MLGRKASQRNELMKSRMLIVIPLYAILIILFFLYQEEIMAWLSTEGMGQIPIILIASTLLAAVPFVPFGIVGGIIGAKYGVIVGGMINLTTSTLAAVLTYMLFRYLFREAGVAYLSKSDKFNAINHMIRKRTFWSVFIGRIIPVMPAFLINCYAGTFRLDFKAFLAATAIGKIPAMLVYAFIGDNAASGASQWMTVLLIYGLFVLFVYGLYRASNRNR
jgi:uncharacterized membrane protein YdjX (TVP38/TMEM64 family)